MSRADWLEHRRADGELVGWLLLEGEVFVSIDRLGRRIGASTKAERALDDLGISFLAGPFELRQDDGSWIPVRIIEASLSEVRVKEEDFGAVGGTLIEYILTVPVGDGLRGRRPRPSV